jgi:hypothetical protein
MLLPGGMPSFNAQLLWEWNGDPLSRVKTAVGMCTCSGTNVTERTQTLEKGQSATLPVEALPWHPNLLLPSRQKVKDPFCTLLYRNLSL